MVPAALSSSASLSPKPVCLSHHATPSHARGRRPESLLANQHAVLGLGPGPSAALCKVGHSASLMRF